MPEILMKRLLKQNKSCFWLITGSSWWIFKLLAVTFAIEFRVLTPVVKGCRSDTMQMSPLMSCAHDHIFAVVRDKCVWDLVTNRMCLVPMLLQHMPYSNGSTYVYRADAGPGEVTSAQFLQGSAISLQSMFSETVSTGFDGSGRGSCVFDGDFFLACEDFGRMFDHLFPAWVFFLKWRLACVH